MVILVVLLKRRVKKRRSLTEYVRAARKWRRKLCKLAAVLQGECTSVLVETEKNSLRCNYFSVWCNWERATLVQEPYSVSQKIDKFAVP